MSDTRVRPVEVLQLAVHPGHVAEVKIAVNERRRDVELREPAADRLQRRRQPPELGQLIRLEVADGLGIVQQRLDLFLQDVQPPIEAPVRQQLVGQLGRAQLQRREAPQRLLPDLERRVEVEQLLERRQQHPAMLRLDAERRRDVAGEPLREPAGDDGLLDEQGQPQRHLEVELGTVGLDAQHRRDAPLLRLLETEDDMTQPLDLGLDPAPHLRKPARARPRRSLLGHVMNPGEVAGDAIALALVCKRDVVRGRPRPTHRPWPGTLPDSVDDL